MPLRAAASSAAARAFARWAGPIAARTVRRTWWWASARSSAEWEKPMAVSTPGVAASSGEEQIAEWASTRVR